MRRAHPLDSIAALFSPGRTESGRQNAKITFCFRTRAFLFWAFMMLCGLLGTYEVSAGSLDHFSWITIPSPERAGAPFGASLTANDNAGGLVSNYSGTIHVSAQIPAVSPVVISEVDNGNTNQVEFTNPSTNSVDVSGWKVVFYSWISWPRPVTIFTIPAGTICPPESVFAISSGGVAPGSFPAFSTGTLLFWNQYAGPLAVSLLNPTNGLVDFFCASTAIPAFINTPVPVLPNGWIGGAVPLNTNLAYTYQRQGVFNQRQAVNWVATNRSVGLLNSSLSLPFTPNYMPVSVFPGFVSLTNGAWSGYLSVQASGSNMVLRVDNGNGNPGNSNPFDVVSNSSVGLSLPTQTFADNPGIQPGLLTIPGAIGTDLVFNLTSDTPSKIQVPSTVVIAAGTNSATFNITNFNDSLLDGVQFVTITAANYLFPTVEGTITNFSVPVQLGLTLPGPVDQNAGVIPGAQLSTSVPVGPNFQSELFSSAPELVATPPFVHIPAGQTNASFDLYVPKGLNLLGNRQVIVTAFAGPAAMTNGSITISGNQSNNLALHMPGRVLASAGSITDANLTLAGTLLTNLTIGLTSSAPSRLLVPSNVTLPPGQTSAVLSLTVISNPAPAEDLSVTVSASAVGFVDGIGTMIIQDDHLDHFGFAGIPLPQTVNQPFPVSIFTENQSGDMLNSYSGTASLSASGLPPGSIIPAQAGPFTNGLWSGTVTINTVATNVAVGAQDGAVSGQSNPFDVEPSFIAALNATVSDLTYDPGTDRLYGAIPSNSTVQSNTVMRVNPYTASVETYIPFDTNPGLMALSASNQYIYVVVQGGFSVERLNLASQTSDLEFALPNGFPNYYAANILGLPNSPESIAIAGWSDYGPTQDFIYDGNVLRTNLTDLALVPGLHNNGILSEGVLYLPGGYALNPTNLQPVGQFPVHGVVGGRPMAPDPASGSVFFLSQQNGQTVIYAYDTVAFTLRGAQTIPGVVGVAQNLVRWGTNGLAFSTTGNQLFLIRSFLCPGPSPAQLSVAQSGPALVTVGSAFSFTINITNSGSISASDVTLYDPLPVGAGFVGATSTQGTVQMYNSVLIGALGNILPHGGASVTVTVQAETAGIISNAVSVMTSAANSNSAKGTSVWLTTVIDPASSNRIAQLQIPINDMVFNPIDGKLYASVSGADATFGNSIVAIEPSTLRVSNPIAVGSEPGALALSQDGRYLYVYLRSSATIELVDLQTGSVTFQYSIWSLALSEMFVLPGDSHSLLFSQYYTGGTPLERGVLILTDGQASMLANSFGLTLIQPSLATNVFYGYDNSVVPSTVDRVQIVGTNMITTFGGGLTYDLESEIRSGGNLLFFSVGEVVDPEAMLHLATFPGLSQYPWGTQTPNHICPDLDSGRVYYISPNGLISAYSLNRYQLTGKFSLAGIIGAPEQLLRWGVNGLAFATTGGQLFSIQTPLVPTNQPADLVVTQTCPPSATLLTNFTVMITVSNQGPGVATDTVLNDTLPSGMRFVSASCAHGTISTNSGTLSAALGTLNMGDSAQISILLRSDAIASTFNYVRVAANEPDPVMTNNSSLQPIANATAFSQSTHMFMGDLVYDVFRGKIFGTVQSAGAYSNSIIQVDPATGSIERSLPTSFPAGKIDISTDGQFLYVGAINQSIVERINIQDWTNDLSFVLPNPGYNVEDFAPLPGQPHSVAVSMHGWYSGSTPEVAIFDDGTTRTNVLLEGGAGAYFIHASQDASLLYVVNVNGSAPDNLTFSPHAITASGVGPALTNVPGYQSDFKIMGNLLISESGKVLNLQNNTTQGTFPVAGLVAPAADEGIVYFLVQYGGANLTTVLMTCSTNMTNILWQLAVPGATGPAFSLIRCGPGTFAFATQEYYGNEFDTSQWQLWLLHTSVVPPAGDLVLSVTTNVTFATGYLTNTFSVLNDGPYNATGVSFSNVLASGSTFMAASSSQGTCVQTNGIVTCSIGSMIPGSTVTITVVSSVPTPGSIPLLASVSKNEPDLDLSNNQISETQMIAPAPSVSISDLSVYRETGLTARFNIVLSSPGAQPLQLYCATTDGSAHSPADYLSSSALLTLQPGVTNAGFSVTIENNGLVESNITFYLNVGLTPSGVPLATATCTLINDNFYSFSVTNVSLIAPLDGTTNAVFVIGLSGTNHATASIDYFTRDGSSSAGQDYLSKSGTLVFPPGVTSGSVSIPVYATANSPAVKNFYLVLANPANGVLGVSQASAFILAPNLVIGPSQLRTDGRFQLTVNGGVSGQSYVLLASTNLVNWTAINGFLDSNPPVTIYDPDASKYRQRFYRIGPLSAAPAITLGPQVGRPFTSNGFNGMLYGLPGLTYEIDASMDLFYWEPVTSFVSTNSPFPFQDPTATNHPHRFYRAVTH